MERRYNQIDYHAEMLPLVDVKKERQQKSVDDNVQAEIDICLNCTRKKCDGGKSCMIKQRDTCQSNKKWTKEECDYVIRNYQTMDIKDIAIALSRTPDGVKSKIHKLQKEKHNENNA